MDGKHWLCCCPSRAWNVVAPGSNFILNNRAGRDGASLTVSLPMLTLTQNINNGLPFPSNYCHCRKRVQHIWSSIKILQIFPIIAYYISLRDPSKAIGGKELPSSHPSFCHKSPHRSRRAVRYFGNVGGRGVHRLMFVYRSAYKTAAAVSLVCDDDGRRDEPLDTRWCFCARGLLDTQACHL